MPAIDPKEVPSHSGSRYPEPFASEVKGRHRKRLGDAAGLKNFGVNLVTLDPGFKSSMRHFHKVQDEFVYVLEGELVLVTNAGRRVLKAGMAAGFPANDGDGHHLINETAQPAVYLEVGDRLPGDGATYPDIDMAARANPDGTWSFTHKDGRPY